MEVKNQMVDQMLVNTVAQAPANQNAKAPKDADRPDFDSMVQKRSAEKDSPKTEKAKLEKTAKNAPVKEAAKTGVSAEQAPITGDQLAIAAALMMQTMPDGPRMAQIQPELIAAENIVTVQAVIFGEGENMAEVLPQTQVAPETPAEADVEVAPELTAAPEAVDTPVQEAPVQERREPGAVQVEAKPVESDKPELAREQQLEQAPRMAENDAPRTEKAPEAPRFVRREERTEAEDDAGGDNAQAAVEAPLFDRVDAPVIKVAEAAKPIPLEAEDGVEQLGTEIRDVIVNSVDANRVEIQLTPENLGKLTVEITRREDGTLNVVLHTETQRAANLLEKGADGLRQVLAANRQQDVQIEVRGSGETQERFLNPDGQNDQGRQQQQQQSGHRNGRHQNAQDFLQQLRLGLVDVDGSNQ